MQPLLEFVKRHARSYTYSIRASRMPGAEPVPCYIDRGHVSLTACLQDAAQALSTNFPRVNVRYQDVCMGEIDARQLTRNAEQIASAWMLADEHRAQARSRRVASEGTESSPTF
ncbi:MAG: hypothetical protein EOP70_08525 [Variovorax sp.]|jgi:hypothetical protein|nr:MAG: hypothetical protein EOP70_08525 [Variovorax sp.]